MIITDYVTLLLCTCPRLLVVVLDSSCAYAGGEKGRKGYISVAGIGFELTQSVRVRVGVS